MAVQSYILVVNHLTGSVVDAARKLRAYPGFENLQLVLLTAHPEKYQRYPTDEVSVVACDFSSKQVITEALVPYLSGLRGVICRGDRHIWYLRQVLPVLPAGMLVAEDRSLAAATNKRLMRTAFAQHSPEITPKFVHVHDATDATVQHVEAHLAYPVIVKPAHLASSLLIQSCRTRAELKVALCDVFYLNQSVYDKEGSALKPEVIVEEYLEGDFYSIDAYVMHPGTIIYCPPIGYVPANQVGFDDFFVYKRFAPTTLSYAEVQAANRVVRKAVDAIGLTFSTVHAELVRTKGGWRMIELGPRIGRYRHIMYDQVYGIDHSLNDMKLHVGIEPEVSTGSKSYCSIYNVYPEREGILRCFVGWQELVQHKEVTWTRQNVTPGDDCLFARHGGHALAEFIIAADDEQRLQTVMEWAERSVGADIV